MARRPRKRNRRQRYQTGRLVGGGSNGVRDPIPPQVGNQCGAYDDEGVWWWNGRCRGACQGPPCGMIGPRPYSGGGGQTRDAFGNQRGGVGSTGNQSKGGKGGNGVRGSSPPPHLGRKCMVNTPYGPQWNGQCRGSCTGTRCGQVGPRPPSYQRGGRIRRGRR